MDAESRNPEPEAQWLTFLADGHFYALHVCPACGAGVLDLELHRRWHSTLQTRGA